MGSRPMVASIHGAMTCGIPTARAEIEANNLFPVRYAEAYHDLMRSAGVDGVTFSRAGFTGSAAFAAHWAGDEDSTWEAFRSSITAGLTAGVGGIFFWGWDLAGFSGPIPDARAVPSLGSGRLLRADHAVPLGVQPLPRSACGPYTVEHRRTHR